MIGYNLLVGNIFFCDSPSLDCLIKIISCFLILNISKGSGFDRAIDLLCRISELSMSLLPTTA